MTPWSASISDVVETAVRVAAPMLDTSTRVIRQTHVVNVRGIRRRLIELFATLIVRAAHDVKGRTPTEVHVTTERDGRTIVVSVRAIRRSRERSYRIPLRIARHQIFIMY